MDGQRPAWRLSEAVERTTASRSTLRRHLENGRLPNAFKDSSGAWRFPVEDLLAAGVTMLKSHPDIPVSVSTGQPVEQPALAQAQRITELEQQLAVERERSSGLERLAEAARTNADDLRKALRMIEGASPGQPVEQALSAPSNPPQEDSLSNPERPPVGRARRILSIIRGH